MSVVQHLSSEEVSHLFGISERSVRRYIHQFEQTGEVQPTPIIMAHKNFSVTLNRWFC